MFNGKKIDVLGKEKIMCHVFLIDFNGYDFMEDGVLKYSVYIFEFN